MVVSRSGHHKSPVACQRLSGCGRQKRPMSQALEPVNDLLGKEELRLQMETCGFPATLNVERASRGPVKSQGLWK